MRKTRNNTPRHKEKNIKREVYFFTSFQNSAYASATGTNNGTDGIDDNNNGNNNNNNNNNNDDHDNNNNGNNNNRIGNV